MEGDTRRDLRGVATRLQGGLIPSQLLDKESGLRLCLEDDDVARVQSLPGSHNLLYRAVQGADGEIRALHAAALMEWSLIYHVADV